MSTPFCKVNIRKLPNTGRYRITRVYSRRKAKCQVYCTDDSEGSLMATEIGRRIGNAIAAEITRRGQKPRKAKS
jgi:hypothetical protein